MLLNYIDINQVYSQLLYLVHACKIFTMSTPSNIISKTPLSVSLSVSVQNVQLSVDCIDGVERGEIVQ